MYWLIFQCIDLTCVLKLGRMKLKQPTRSELPYTCRLHIRQNNPEIIGFLLHLAEHCVRFAAAEITSTKSVLLNTDRLNCFHHISIYL